MKTGPLLRPDTGWRRFSSRLLSAAITVVRRVSARPDSAASGSGRRRAVELIRPLQFIGVIPADIAEEKAR